MMMMLQPVCRRGPPSKVEAVKNGHRRLSSSHVHPPPSVVV